MSIFKLRLKMKHGYSQRPGPSEMPSFTGDMKKNRLIICIICIWHVEFCFFVLYTVILS